MVLIILGVVGGLGYLALRIKLQEDISQFIPQDKEVKKYSDALKNIRLNDKLILAVHLDDTAKVPDAEELVAFGERLTERIKKRWMGSHIREITFRLSESGSTELQGVFSRNLPYFLDSADYVTIDSLLNPKSLREKLEKDYRTLVTPAGAALKQMIAEDPLGLTALAMKKLSTLQAQGNYTVLGDCIFTGDRKNLLIFINSAHSSDETADNATLLEGIDEAIDSCRLEAQMPVSADYFGAIAVAAGNATQMKRDTILTMGIALGLLLLLLAFFYRRLRVIFLLILPVAMGALFAIAMMQLIRGELSTIAIGAGSIILGIAINYSIHFFTHLKHTGSRTTTIADLAGPMTIGSITTIGAFLSLLFVESKALQDFGLFAAFVLIGSVLFTLIVLPHLSGKKKGKAQNVADSHSWIERISAIRFENSKVWIIIILLITAGLAYFAPQVKFDSDMSNMSYMSERLKATEKRLNSVTDTNLNAVYIASRGATLDDALRKAEEVGTTLKGLKDKGKLFSFASPGSLLLSSKQEEQRSIQWSQFWARRFEDLKTRLLHIADSIGFSSTAFDPFFEKISMEKPAGFDTKDREFIKSHYAQDFILDAGNEVMALTMLKVRKDQHDAVLASLPVSNDVIIIDRATMAAAFANIINNDFNRILLLTSLLVLVFLTMSYGRLELGLLAFIPMLISWVWILGIMALLGIEFNIFSIILSAFIFGLGDDYSIFILDGLLQKFKTGKENLDSFKTAVFLSALTTLIGVGVLIFAKHPALRSIALTTIIGMATVVLISYTVSPAIFKWMTTTRSRKRTFPVTLGGMLYAFVFYSYFIGGCIFTVLMGYTVIKILPVNRKKRKLAYHYMLYLVCKTTIYIMFMAKKRFIHFNKETFKKPCLVVCNHQSIIDIPLALMWTPKMVMITNDRVYKSKLIGQLVKLGGFFPASSGYEEIHGKLQDLVKDGYSIFVFPEGTRAEDRKVKRFHKGAFYLAEQLNMEILPMVMHGTGEYIRKGEYFGRRTYITVKFLDRILPTDLSWGNTYSERTKSIQKAFHKEFYQIKEQYYTSVDYHKDLLVRNFIYKGPILECYMRIKIRLEDNYRFFNEILPRKGAITDVGCGYGFLSYMLALVSEDRIITGIDYDQEKIEVAENGISRPKNAHFIHGDVLEIPFERSRAFIIADVLHYMPVDWQKRVIQKCLDHLEPDGMIVIRDADTSLGTKHRGTALTEFFSTKVLGFNKTRQNKELFFTSRETIYDSLKNTNFAVEVVDETRFTSNVFYIIRQQR